MRLRARRFRCLDSGRYLARHEVGQVADSGEHATVNFIILNRKPETLFKGGEDSDNRHGIEFGNGAQQGGVGIELGSPPFEVKDVVQDGSDFLLDVQRILQSKTMVSQAAL